MDEWETNLQKPLIHMFWWDLKPFIPYPILEKYNIYSIIYIVESWRVIIEPKKNIFWLKHSHKLGPQGLCFLFATYFGLKFMFVIK